MKKTLSIACAMAVPLLFSQSATAAFDYFKKAMMALNAFLSLQVGYMLSLRAMLPPLETILLLKRVLTLRMVVSLLVK